MTSSFSQMPGRRVCMLLRWTEDAIEQKRQETQHASQNLVQTQGGLSVRSPKAKNNMEDRLSPMAQDLVKRTAKVKCTFSNLVVEERKERKRALESKSREKKRFRWRPLCWYWSPTTTCSICWSACDGNGYNRQNRSWLKGRCRRWCITFHHPPH
jgi:hypothetical protein